MRRRAMLRVEIVAKEKAPVLQLSLYEMSGCYDEVPDEDGCFAYPYLPLYFTEPQRTPYFLYDGETRVGFAPVNDHSFTEERVDSTPAEFTIFPAYRRRGYALQAVDALLRARPGVWQLKYSTENACGRRLWERVTERCHGRVTPPEGTEPAVTFVSGGNRGGATVTLRDP